ncbi:MULTISPECIES: efflux RND transporter periplasmic adaptor subunit [Rheinheimera]|uniref:Efflux RND transporter periplasmic adaptor subunit n=1 Tax=Rheinheimera marina TaxID=1774958 RepID=A0ABV9JP47_9GAMM
MQPNRITLYLFSALAGSVLLAACGQAEQGAAQGQQAPAVGVVELKAQTLTLSRELPGRTSAYQIAQIRPQVSGIIERRQFTEGAEVKAGQALYQIDPAPFEAALASAKAAEARASAAIASSEAKANRYRELIKIKAISQQELDEADAAYKQARADLLTAQAQIKTAQINLNYSKVKAPISGQISKSSVTAGALVSANQEEALATVTSLDPIYVDLTQSSTELLQLKKALASGELGSAEAVVELTLEDGTAYAHKGSLQFSEVTVNPDTGSVTLRAQFPNPDKLLLPGMYVRASVPEGVKSNVILAPQRGVSRNAKGEATAMVLNKDGVVEPRVLTTERSIGSEWLVTAGLSAGERLIVEGLQKIRPGAPATATAAESTPSSNAASSK